MGDLKGRQEGGGDGWVGGLGGCLHCLRHVLCGVKGSIDLLPLFLFYPPVCLFLHVYLALLVHLSFYPLTFAAVGTNLAKMEPLPHFFLN